MQSYPQPTTSCNSHRSSVTQSPPSITVGQERTSALPSGNHHRSRSRRLQSPLKTRKTRLCFRTMPRPPPPVPPAPSLLIAKTCIAHTSTTPLRDITVTSLLSPAPQRHLQATRLNRRKTFSSFHLQSTSLRRTASCNDSNQSRARCLNLCPTSGSRPRSHRRPFYPQTRTRIAILTLAPLLP